MIEWAPGKYTFQNADISVVLHFTHIEHQQQQQQHTSERKFWNAATNIYTNKQTKRRQGVRARAENKETIAGKKILIINNLCGGVGQLNIVGMDGLHVMFVE